MGDMLVKSESLVAVAEAIRAKSGTSDVLTFPGGFVDAVGAIQAGGDSQEIVEKFLTRTMTSIRCDSITVLPRYSLKEFKNLESVYFPELVTTPIRLFKDCTSLKYVSMPKWTGDGSGSETFVNCKSLTDESFDMPLFVKMVHSCFRNCTGLKNVPNMLNLTQVGDMSLQDCTGLTTLSFPEVITLGHSAFKGCTSLVFVDVGPKLDNPSSVGGVRYSVFEGCTSLVTVILRPKTLQTLNNINAFTNTPIAAGEGYVYVPKVLSDGSDGVAAYRAATNWTVYADQIRAIEDYPEITGG